MEGVDAWGTPYNAPFPYQPIPMEYQGYVFMIFFAVGIIAVLYMFYMIATDERVGVYK